MTKTEKILRALKKIERCYNDLDDDLYDVLDEIRSLLKNNPPIKIDGVLAKMLGVKNMADSEQALVSCQGQAMDGYSELANYRSILDNITY
jgi:hypothetical protein